MADRVSTDERALRRELQDLAKKREALDSSKRRGSGTAPNAAGRRSVFARLGDAPPRGGGRQVVQHKENNARGNATGRLGKRDHEDNRQNNAVKRQRLHSAVTRPDGARHAEERAEAIRSTEVTSPSANNARTQERKQRAVAPYAQKDGIARSRRMFGALMGHLGKAKRQIEKDTDLFKRQDSKQHEAEQREKIQSQNLEDQARLKAEIARLEALVTRTELDRSEKIARAKLEHLQMTRKSESQSKFLVTIASPPIYYLPLKHTKETKELVAASMEAHEAKMKANERVHEEKLRKLETEFSNKLDQLRDELDDLKNGEKDNGGGEQPRDKRDDAMEDGDEDMDHVRKEPENDMKDEQVDEDMDHVRKEPENDVKDEQVDEDMNMSDGSPKQDENIEEIVSGSEAEENGVVETRRSNNEETTNEDTVKGEPKRDVKVVNDDIVTHSDMEASSSPRRVEESKAELIKEGAASPKQNGETTELMKVEAAKEEPADPKQNSEAAELMKEGSAIPEKNGKASDRKEVNEAETTHQSDVAAKPTADVKAKDVKPKADPTAAVAKMKVTELRAELKKRGLDSKGLKAKLVQRLKQAMHEEDEST